MGKGADGCKRSGGMDMLQSSYLLASGIEEPEITVPGVKAAAASIVRRLQSGEKVAVFADYDPDGTSSAAILKLALQDYADQIMWGYAHSENGTGLDARFVRMAARNGCKALITVDLGSGQPGAVREARELGLETVITDHHHPHPALQADHHLNPQLHTVGHQASGAVVAYKLGLELQSALGGVQPDFASRAAWLAGFAARADMMDLETKENSALIKLAAGSTGTPPGLQAAAESLGLKSLAPSNQGKIAALLNLPKRTPLAQAAWSAGVLAARDKKEAEHYLKQLLAVREQCSHIQKEYLGRAWAGHNHNQGQGVALAVIQEEDSHLYAGYAGIIAMHYAKTSGHPAAVFIPQDKEGTRFKWSLRTGPAETGPDGALEIAYRLKDLPTPDGASPTGGHKQAMGGICTAEQIDQVKKVIQEWARDLSLPLIQPQAD